MHSIRPQTSDMDPNASFGVFADTFSTTFSTTSYPSNNSTTSRSKSSPDTDYQPLASEPSPSTSDPVTSRKSATSPTSTSGINPRSCTTCRKRKVRCDKRHPCSNCYKAGIECIFPRPGRAPRRSKKPPDSELLARLRRLEGVVQSLGKGADGEDLVSEENRHEESEEPLYELGQPPGCKKRDKNSDTTSGLEKEMGRLFVGDGKSRYVSNSFWANLTTEVCLIAPSASLLNMCALSTSFSQSQSHAFSYSCILIDGFID